MKFVKSCLLAAALFIVAVALAPASALADPIRGPWSGIGAIGLDAGLWGSDCSALAVVGATDGSSMDSVIFGGCRGAAGTPTALSAWAVAWNARNTGGVITVNWLENTSGLAQCLYQGDVAFTYNATTRVMAVNVNRVGVPLVTQLGGLPICISAIAIEGSIAVS